MLKLIAILCLAAWVTIVLAVLSRRTETCQVSPGESSSAEGER